MWIKDDPAESRRDRNVVAAVQNLSAQTCAHLLLASLAISTVLALLTGLYR